LLTAVEEIMPIVSQGLFFMLVLTINLKDSKAYFYLRKYSMVIYLVHNFFSIMLKAFVLDYGILLFASVTIISLVIAMVVIYFAENKKVKWLKAILN
jgi:peptidoglycan/LPS O-acetylase OafA/YrhL